METKKRLEYGNNVADTVGSRVVKKKTAQIGIAKKCNSAPETRNMMLENDGCISFTPKFTLLSSNIDFILGRTEDVKNRIKKSSKSMGGLRFLWNEKDAPLEAKIKICTNIPISILLWGGDDWSRNKDDVRRIEKFQNKAIYRTLGTTMAQVKEEETTNDEIRRRLGNALKVADAWRNRQLLLADRIARMKLSKYPRQLLTATCVGKRNRVMPFRTIRGSFVDVLKLLVKDTDESGDLKDWYGFAKNKNEWKRMIKNRIRV